MQQALSSNLCYKFINQCLIFEMIGCRYLEELGQVATVSWDTYAKKKKKKLNGKLTLF